ncbi:RNA polymerase sigma factor [Salinicoccus cyprini]|nr:sigma-70 family RNA polymerase sigma factor [Salinicoccus cyprini]
MYQITAFHFTVREKNIDDTLDALAARVREGDMEAFDLMDEKLRPQISRMSYRYMDHFHEREDMEQDMMEAALRLCHRYQSGRGRYRHYLFRTLRFEMKSRMRTHGLKYYNESMTVEDRRLPKPVDKDEEEADPINMMVREEQLQYLMHKKGVCSPLERMVLEYLGKGHDIDDVCREFALERKSVINTLHRIRRKKERLVSAEWAEDAFDNVD